MIFRLPFIYMMIIGSTAFAQDFKSDIHTVMNHMMPPEGISSYSMKIRYQDKLNSAKAVDSLYGEYRFSGNKYVIRMNNIETIQNEQYLVSSNSEEKILLVCEPQKQSHTGFNYLSLDSLFGAFKYVISCDQNGVELIYTIKTEENNPVDSMVIRMERKRMILKQVIICFNKEFRISEDFEHAAFLIMDYSDYNYEDGHDQSRKWFDTGKYFTLSGKKLIPSNEYKQYRLINNMALAR